MGPRETVKPAGKTSRTQLVVLGGLSVVAIAVVVRMLSAGPSPAAAATDATDASEAPADLIAATPAPAAAAPISVSWPDDVARDPFNSTLVFPPVETPKPKTHIDPAPAVPAPVDLAALAKDTIHLKATVLGERPMAMINGRLFRVGEVVEGFKILEIGTDRITIGKDGSRLLLNASKD